MIRRVVRGCHGGVGVREVALGEDVATFRVVSPAAT